MVTSSSDTIRAPHEASAEALGYIADGGCTLKKIKAEKKFFYTIIHGLASNFFI
ncbi:MAG TPA: hypothetical protein VKA08_00815 [Balneolales bacterium]|nr:hypothetical protein [Balneolales bacterium]